MKLLLLRPEDPPMASVTEHTACSVYRTFLIKNTDFLHLIYAFSCPRQKAFVCENTNYSNSFEKILK